MLSALFFVFSGTCCTVLASPPTNYTSVNFYITQDYYNQNPDTDYYLYFGVHGLSRDEYTFNRYSSSSPYFQEFAVNFLDLEVGQTYDYTCTDDSGVIIFSGSLVANSIHNFYSDKLSEVVPENTEESTSESTSTSSTEENTSSSSGGDIFPVGTNNALNNIHTDLLIIIVILSVVFGTRCIVTICKNFGGE